jgi:BirA family biotin operon repressor/biotin-[acetyl-CoA-carboxylase] ligase
VAEGGGDGVPLAARVFAALADGQVHSGEGLAHSLGVTRSAVWKAAEMLRELGVSLDAARNRGYSMHCAVAPLDAGSIRAALPTGTRERVSTLEVEWCMESTNGALAARGYPVAGESQVLLAEFQTAGRGRRGRRLDLPLAELDVQAAAAGCRRAQSGHRRLRAARAAGSRPRGSAAQMAQ